MSHTTTLLLCSKHSNIQYQTDNSPSPYTTTACIHHDVIHPSQTWQKTTYIKLNYSVCSYKPTSITAIFFPESRAFGLRLRAMGSNKSSVEE